MGADRDTESPRGPSSEVLWCSRALLRLSESIKLPAVSDAAATSGISVSPRLDDLIASLRTLVSAEQDQLYATFHIVFSICFLRAPFPSHLHVWFYQLFINIENICWDILFATIGFIKNRVF